MDIEFDRNKNRSNIVKHGLSLSRIVDMDWDNALVIEDSRKDYGESRWVVVAELEGILHTACFTYRGDIVRVINMRKAHKKEREIYYG